VLGERSELAALPIHYPPRLRAEFQVHDMLVQELAQDPRIDGVAPDEDTATDRPASVDTEGFKNL
jgi:hypothetical protein